MINEGRPDEYNNKGERKLHSLSGQVTQNNNEFMTNIDDYKISKLEYQKDVKQRNIREGEFQNNDHSNADPQIIEQGDMIQQIHEEIPAKNIFNVQFVHSKLERQAIGQGFSKNQLNDALKQVRNAINYDELPQKREDYAITYFKSDGKNQNTNVTHQGQASLGEARENYFYFNLRDSSQQINPFSFKNSLENKIPEQVVLNDILTKQQVKEKQSDNPFEKKQLPNDSRAIRQSNIRFSKFHESDEEQQNPFAIKKVNLSDKGVKQIKKEVVKKSLMRQQSENSQNPFQLKAKGQENKIIVRRSEKKFDIQSIFKTYNNNLNAESIDQLEIILQASPLYKDYMMKTHTTERKLINKISIDVPELRSFAKQLSTIPKDLFYKPPRIQFRKSIDVTMNLSSNNTSNYVCMVSDEGQFIFFQELKHQNTKILNGSQCEIIQINKEDKLSKNMEYDHLNNRIFCFSNHHQALFVYSPTSKEFLCKVYVQKKVINPILIFYTINSRQFLLLIGGYTQIQKDTVQGNKFIQIFEIKRWQIGLKSRLIKLIIGRISPVVVFHKVKDASKLLLLGGHTIACISKKGELNFTYEKDINYSTNLTGISIDSKEILDLFDYQQVASYKNLSVKIENPMILYSGYALAIRSSLMLLLPTSSNMHQLKVINKQINIIERSNQLIGIYSPLNEYHKMELNFVLDKGDIILYRINDRGILQILKTNPEQKADKWNCNIY